MGVAGLEESCLITFKVLGIQDLRAWLPWDLTGQVSGWHFVLHFCPSQVGEDTNGS